MAAPTLLVQLSDLHIREAPAAHPEAPDPVACLRRAVEAVLARTPRPHAVVLTGDLVDAGRDSEYATLRQGLAPLEAAGIALHVLPGNHDDREALRRAFADHATLRQTADRPWIQYAVDVGALRLVALDTVVPGQGGGALDAGRLQWLAEALEASRGRPVVVAMHHPPFRTLIDGMDAIGLGEGAGALEVLVARHPNVERIVCGHLHRAIDARFGGTLASTCPGPAHQIALDLAPGAPLAWTREPPGYRLHAWDPAARRLVTHVATTAAYGGPHRYA